MIKIKILVLLFCLLGFNLSFMSNPGQEAEIKLSVTIPQSITLEVLAGSQQARDTQESEAIAVVTLTEDDNACLVWSYCCVGKNSVVDLYIESAGQILPIEWHGTGCFFSEGIFDGSPQLLTSWMGPGQHDGKIMFDIEEGRKLDLTFNLKTKGE